MIDVLLIVSVLALVLVLARFLFRPSAPPVVGITVRAGRQITVNGRSFPEQADPAADRTFEVPFKDIVRPGADIELSIVTAPGGPETPVVLRNRGTKTLNIDASHATHVVVYGGYERIPSGTRQSAVAGKCIWCRNGVIVCGLMPRCP